jgi:hypothetical protein
VLSLDVDRSQQSTQALFCNFLKAVRKLNVPRRTSKINHNNKTSLEVLNMTTGTATTTDTEVKVMPAVLAVAKALTSAASKFYSKYWDAAEVAVELGEAKHEDAFIRSQFLRAFEQTNYGVTEGQPITSSIKSTQRVMAGRMVHFASKGRAWFEAEKAAGKGFWLSVAKMEAERKQSKIAAEGVKTSDENESPATTLSNRSGTSKGRKSRKSQPADTKVTVDQRSPMDQCVEMVQAEPFILMEVIEGLVSKGKLAYVDLIRDLIDKAKLSKDAIESIKEQLTKKAEKKQAKE